MRSETVASVELSPNEVVALFTFLARTESDLPPNVFQVMRRLERAVSRATTIEEMEALRGTLEPAPNRRG